MSAEVVSVNQDCCSFHQQILRENNFVCVRYWLNELTGRKIEDFERFTIQSRLWGCADRLGFANVNQFVEHLGTQTSDFSHPCWQALLDSALETDSWFRRESRHFDFLRQIVLPEMGEACHILSAGCGGGEEAFDIAFECAEQFGLDCHWQLDAIDIRAEAIEWAKSAWWSPEDCALLPERYVAQYFEPCYQGFKVQKGVRDKIEFRIANLLKAQTDKQYQVIFCRNLLMEMEKHCVQTLTEKLFNWLKPGGYLIVSSSENLAGYIAPDFLLSPHIARKPQI